MQPGLLDLFQMRTEALNQSLARAVGTTLRVVRVNSRTSSRVSRWRMAWLSADCDTPSWAAARAAFTRHHHKGEQIVYVLFSIIFPD